MNKEIQERINAVQSGSIPNGYCEGIVGILPNYWTSKPLSEISEVISEQVGDNDYETLSISAGIGFVNQAQKFGKELSGKQYKKYTVLRKGDFAYNKGNSKLYPQGCTYRLKERDEAAVPNVFECFRITEGCPEYYEQLFISGFMNRQLTRKINHGVRDDGLLNLTDDDFYSTVLPVPPLAEQQKIAKILSACDSVIKLKQELIAENRKVFLHSMALIFGCSDEYTTLGKIAEITMGQSPDSSSYNTGEDGVPLLQGNADIANGLPLPRYYTNSPTKMCSPGEILLSVRAPVGEVSKTHISACIGRGLCSINAGKLTEYVFYYLKYYGSNSQGSTFTAISGDDIKKIQIPVADEKMLLHQIEVLSCADTKIHLLEQELEAWQQKKKVLMQLLLTGLVRTND